MAMDTRTHQFLVTLTVHTNKINPATTPTATLAGSLKNGHPMVVIQGDGQQPGIWCLQNEGAM
jgi:hypothetical protein